MSEENPTQGAPDEGAAQDGQHNDQGKKEPVFTQADVDRIVKKKAEELYRRRVGDVDIEALKAKAGESATAEERIAALEQKIAEERTTALRARVAARFGVSTEPGEDGEPSDADLFLTGADEETLTRQAQRLAARESSRKQRNTVPREGNNPRTAPDERAAFADFLTGNAV